MFAPALKIPDPPGKPKPQRDKSSLYVEAETWQRLDVIAKELGRSRNALVRGVLSDWIVWYDERKKSKKSQ